MVNEIIAKTDGTTLYEHTEKVLKTALYINEHGKFGLSNDVLRLASIFHDLGKANPNFLKNINSNHIEPFRHELSSILFIDSVPEDIRKEVGMIIISHHKPLILEEDRSLKGMLNKRNPDIDLFPLHIDGIEVWGKYVVDFLKEYYGINASIPSYERCIEIYDEFEEYIDSEEYGWSEYRGVFCFADHFASCYNFNDAVLDKCLKQLFKYPDISFYNGKNEKYPLSLIDSDDNKQHTFVIAPTGCGKTNFMMKRCKNRIMYILPFQASINAMYKRIRNDIGKDITLGVKHASINSLDFINFTERSLSSFYGLPITVMTPFQILSICFRTKGYETVIMDLQGQDVILDEIHTYGGITQTCVIELIKVLKSIGCRIHICTATIPSYLKDNILDILGKNNTQIVELDKDTLKTFNRHIIHTVNSFDYDEIKRRYENGEKILIVRNTVKKSVSTYKKIESILPDSKKLLLHSRFKRKDRNELERKLMEYNSSSEPCILVSTQVVEVSLDINFDCMFTDCADIMSLIQRFGRINRQRKNIGVYKDIFVMQTNNEFDSKPYDFDICKRTFKELCKYNGNVLEETDIQSIIDRIHCDDKVEKFSISCPYNENGMWKSKKYTNELKNIAEYLEFDGFICIFAEDYERYKETRNKDLEVSISKSLTEGVEYDEKMGIYIFPNSRYSKVYGLN